MSLQFINNIDWNQISICWLIFEQVLSQSDLKVNSSFELIIAIVNNIIRVFTKKKDQPTA